MVLNVTQNALRELAKISKPHKYIKIFVSSGGCNGIQWNMTHVAKNKLESKDEKVNSYLVVDGISVFHLLGSTLDYKKSLKASEFTLSNPNAAGSCGCGKSFNI